MRTVRLAATTLVAVGLVGTALILCGVLTGPDASILFPLSVPAGIVTLYQVRPRNDVRAATRR